MVSSTDHSKAVVLVLVSLCCFVAYSMRRFVLCLALHYFILVFFSPFSIVITSLGKRELVLVLFIHLFDLCLFGFVCFLFLLASGKDCGLRLWHSLDFSLTAFFYILIPLIFCFVFVSISNFSKFMFLRE